MSFKNPSIFKQKLEKLVVPVIFVAVLAGVGTLSAWAKQGNTAAENLPINIVEQPVGKLNYSVTKIIVNAKPESCFKVITNYKMVPSVFPTMKKCLVLHEKGNVKTVRYVTRPTGTFSDYDYTLEVTETPNQGASWKRVSGDFKTIEGFWKFEPTANGQKTIVTYGSYVDGGFFPPQVLIKRQLKIDLPACLTAFKHTAEGLSNVSVAEKSGSSQQ